jgi:AbiTii
MGDNMESIVLELQKEAFQNNTPVSVLLRKAYILSKKLKVDEFANWAYLELNGYKDGENLPDYRMVYGQVKALNPYHGYIPAYFQKEIEEIINNRKIQQSTTEIELYVKQGEENKGMLMFNYPTESQLMLMKLIGVELDYELSLHVPVSHFSRILDRIRNIILDWTLKLEEEGVLGEGMNFSDKEQEKAMVTTPQMVTYIGTMVNSQLQQNTQDSQQSFVIEEFKIENLASLIPDLKKLQEEIKYTEQKQELASEISVLETQVTSPKPKKGIIRETLKSVRNIAEGTTGSLVATSIQEKVTLLLAAIGVS